MFCCKCNIEKQESEFGLDKSRFSGRFPWCKPCKNLWTSNRRKNNPTVYIKKVTKKCPNCGETKLVDQFNRNQAQYDGLKPWCRVCDKKQKKDAYIMPLNRNSYLVKNYGLTLEEYNMRLEAQNEVCLICEEPCIRLNLCVDHDHTTGKVRGLLCYSCNLAIGNMKDKPDLLRKAADYLEQFESVIY